MQSIIKLANEIPWIMAPAFCIALMVVISALINFVRFLEKKLN
jgi:hypothetical protein